ncbi:methylated-DNA--[protein]-cysteine S-methyltransferase [Sphaerisporangium corydalis]|uniref:Methylated-DNA--[protein]-cysteine S-methyltransferase n=1 Tax=Sphaerisporangium corydalis TaxID=1441875 RepID=A0ABV9E959_9ACTN|nr:methylated-DNA--[protein]-cysteine S-methyltransferase [Sphaerisporangium corydalis]
MATGEDDLARVARMLAELAPGPVDLTGRLFAQWCTVGSPVGEVYVASTDRGVCYLRTGESVGGDDQRFLEQLRDRLGRPARRAARPPAGVAPALRSGRPGRLPLDLRGLSDFERAVLEATARIPVGETRPYRWVAERIARPTAVRAVASALGRNPVPLLIPCHRVTRANGDIGGYVFGGQVKERLLRLEDVNVDEVNDLAGEHVYFLGSDTTNIVCFPTCHHARRITEPHRQGFRTIAQARRAGYRPCKHCKPAELAA